MQYKGHKIAVSSDGEGKFTIEKKPGLMLTISALSYKTATVKVDEKTSFLEIKLKDDSHKLGEVVVKSKKGRYKRKDNPAVELMRRVIAAKKKSDLSNYDYYQYDKYQKITLALNDITKEQMEGKFFSKRQYLLDQVELSLVSLVLHACIRDGKAVIINDTTCYLLLRHHLECRNHQEDEHQIQFSYTFHYLIIYIGALRPLLIILYFQAAKL